MSYFDKFPEEDCHLLLEMNGYLLTAKVNLKNATVKWN